MFFTCKFCDANHFFYFFFFSLALRVANFQIKKIILKKASGTRVAQPFLFLFFFLARDDNKIVRNVSTSFFLQLCNHSAFLAILQFFQESGRAVIFRLFNVNISVCKNTLRFYSAKLSRSITAKTVTGPSLTSIGKWDELNCNLSRSKWVKRDRQTSNLIRI